MKLFKILALIALTSSCAPTYISISGSIPPEIQQNIAPALSKSIKYQFTIPDTIGEFTAKIAPQWDVIINPVNPLRSAISELIANKFPSKSNSSPNHIYINVVSMSHNVSRRGPNPTAFHLNISIRADIRNGDNLYSRTFRHKASVAVIGTNSTFFIRAQDSIESMILAFVIDLDKFIQASKI